MRQPLVNKAPSQPNLRKDFTREDIRAASGVLKYVIQNVSELAYLDPEFCDIAYVAEVDKVGIFNGVEWVVLIGYERGDIYDNFEQIFLNTDDWIFHDLTYYSELPTPTDDVNIAYVSTLGAYYIFNETSWKLIGAANPCELEKGRFIDDRAYISDGDVLRTLDPLLFETAPTTGTDEAHARAELRFEDAIYNRWYYIVLLDCFFKPTSSGSPSRNVYVTKPMVMKRENDIQDLIGQTNFCVNTGLLVSMSTLLEAAYTSGNAWVDKKLVTKGAGTIEIEAVISSGEFRYDLVQLDKDGNIELVSSSEGPDPVLPEADSDALALALITVDDEGILYVDDLRVMKDVKYVIQRGIVEIGEDWYLFPNFGTKYTSTDTYDGNKYIDFPAFTTVAEYEDLIFSTDTALDEITDANKVYYVTDCGAYFIRTVSGGATGYKSKYHALTLLTNIDKTVYRSGTLALVDNRHYQLVRNRWIPYTFITNIEVDDTADIKEASIGEASIVRVGNDFFEKNILVKDTWEQIGPLIIEHTDTAIGVVSSVILKVGTDYYFGISGTWEPITGDFEYKYNREYTDAVEGDIMYNVEFNLFQIKTATHGWQTVRYIIFNNNYSLLQNVAYKTELEYFRPEHYPWSKTTTLARYKGASHDSIYANGSNGIEHLELGSLTLGSDWSSYPANLIVRYAGNWYRRNGSSNAFVTLTYSTASTLQDLFDADLRLGDFAIVGSTLYTKTGYHGWTPVSYTTSGSLPTVVNGQYQKVGSNFYYGNCWNWEPLTIVGDYANTTVLDNSEIVNGTYYYVTELDTIFQKVSSVWVNKSKLTELTGDVGCLAEIDGQHFTNVSTPYELFTRDLKTTVPGKTTTPIISTSNSLGGSPLPLVALYGFGPDREWHYGIGY